MVLAGHSAGGMLALHSAYADKGDLAALVQLHRDGTSGASAKEKTHAGDAGAGDPGHPAAYAMKSGTAKADTGKPATGKPATGVIAIINFWGAIYDTTWLTRARIPIVSVHGSKDRVVPYNYGEAPVFGSAVIHRVADRQGIINALKTYPGIGHELQKHFNPLYAGPIARKRWRASADFAAAFLQKRLQE
jgi:acetyl esterase/lipase